jgi:AcrR family transcriptional regulator
MDDAPRLDVDDAVNDAILTATLTLVGSRGLVSTTLADIASEAGVTLADVTVRYASPVRCLEEATFRQNEVGYRLNHDLTLDLERRLGRGGAEAVAIREALQPGRDLGRDMALEQGRSGWRHPEILAAQLAALEAYRSGLLDSETWDARESPTEFYLNVATSLGMYALPRLDPRVAHLPLDVVYIPLYEILQGQG